MNTVSDNIKEIIIQKSRFISHIYQVNDLEDVKKKLKSVKELYKGANHYCYAYIIDQYIKYSDDNEPVGTAGLPILNVLQKKQVNHCLCIVVRYFGGIKLGSGGLIRSYSKACKDALHIQVLKEGYTLQLQFSYDKENKITSLLSNASIIHKVFDIRITYIIEITIIEYEKIKLQLLEISDVTILKEIWI